MTKNEIISNLYTDKDVAQAIEKMNPVELQDDLRQEMFLVLCEMNESRLVDMHKNGFLKYYLVRTMLTMIKSDRSTFHTKFRRLFHEIGSGIIDKPDQVNDNNEDLHVRIEKTMKQLHWYENSIFNLYAENKNISELSRQTAIPYRSLSKTISDTRKKIKQKMKETSAKGYQLVHANMGLVIELDASMDPADIADSMEFMTEYFREKMQGMIKNQMMIKKIKDIMISHIQS
jgi:DNA-directed RNA polymerase specialized sigma24 family protein